MYTKFGRSCLHHLRQSTRKKPPIKAWGKSEFVKAAADLLSAVLFINENEELAVFGGYMLVFTVFYKIIRPKVVDQVYRFESRFLPGSAREGSAQ